MAPKLYYNEVSPAARAVLLTIKALGDIDVEYKVVNLMAGEQFNPEYLKVSSLQLQIKTAKHLFFNICANLVLGFEIVKAKPKRCKNVVKIQGVIIVKHPEYIYILFNYPVYIYLKKLLTAN